MVHRTMKGVPIDMESIIIANGKKVAVGNMSVNARGDLLGQGGEILQTSSERTQQYYKGNPKAVKDISLKDPVDESTLGIGAPKKEIAKVKKAKETILPDGSITLDPENDEGNKL